MASIRVQLTETGIRRPGVGYLVEATLTVKARILIPGLMDDFDDNFDDDFRRPRGRPPGPRSNVTFVTALAGTASGTSGADGELSLTIDTRAAERRLLGNLDQISGASGSIIEHRAVLKVRQPSGALLIHDIRKQVGSSFRFDLRVPRRRVVVLDIDGLRWDVLYRHLKRVRDAGAGINRRYRFEPRPEASDDTVIGSGKDLRSGLAFLCFDGDSGMVDVRLPRAPYPSFTFPSHATMFTGVTPGRHGITGNEFATRVGSGPVITHRWENLPRAPSLQGFCTSHSGDIRAGIDWFVGGFGLADDDDCTDRNRGLVSDLLVPTVYERLHRVGLRTCVIHNFFHGAREPWTQLGMDQWWHLSNSEMRTIKDICSDEDVDQFEPFDAAAFVKAHALLRYRPSTVEVKRTRGRQKGGSKKRREDEFDSIRTRRADGLASKLDGGFPEDRFRGEPHPLGPPDLTTIYVASVDKGSHVGGLANQETYLAWYDNRLAAFIDDYRRLYPRDFNNTVFAVIADHGHQDLVPGEGITTEVEFALLEIVLGVAPGELSNFQLALRRVVLTDRVAVFSQGMNLAIHLGRPGPIDGLGEIPTPLEAARLLLDRPLPVTPYAALVKDRDLGRYRLLARGESDLVDFNSDSARTVLAAHLDLPPPDDADLAATAVRPGGLVAERRLRENLQADPLGTLRIPELIAGLMPPSGGTVDRSPDVVLLAPEREAFSGNASTHGSFGYPLLRVPMLFCGPAVRADTEIATADMVDFTPTLLALLGVDVPEDLDGQARLDYYGQPVRPFTVTPRTPVVAPPRTAPLDVQLAGDPVVSRDSERMLDLAARQESDDPAPGSAPNEFVVTEITTGRRRELGQPTWSRYEVAANSPDDEPIGPLNLCRVGIQLPHLPRWLTDTLNGALDQKGVLLCHTDGNEEIALSVRDFCEMVDVVAERVVFAAIETADRAVTVALDGATAEGHRWEGLADAWTTVTRAADAPSQRRSDLPGAIRAAATCAELTDDRALQDALGSVAELTAIDLERNGSPYHPVERACSVIERLLVAPEIASATGLLWS